MSISVAPPPRSPASNGAVSVPINLGVEDNHLNYYVGSANHRLSFPVVVDSWGRTTAINVFRGAGSPREEPVLQCVEGQPDGLQIEVSSMADPLRVIFPEATPRPRSNLLSRSLSLTPSHHSHVLRQLDYPPTPTSSPSPSPPTPLTLSRPHPTAHHTLTLQSPTCLLIRHNESGVEYRVSRRGELGRVEVEGDRVGLQGTALVLAGRALFVGGGRAVRLEGYPDRVEVEGQGGTLFVVNDQIQAMD
jgi:hypothetical protein